MKKMLTLSVIGVFVFLLSIGASIRVSAADSKQDFRAVWASSAFNLDFPSKRGLSNNEIKKEIDTLLDRAVTLGLNAVIVQVRPAADALYPSSLFPWSEALTGTQGKAPTYNFDPLAYWVEQAHTRGLELHAWINPFRITYASAKITDVKKLSADHPARKNPSWAIAYKEALYFDPGRPECRQLIADGVAEIVQNYAVDGVHLDDYFYPGTDFNDDATYQLYGNGVNRDDWRRENINSLIKLLQQTVKNINSNVRFGCSPAAIWQNRSSDPLGSDTRGYETYKSAYADTRRWVKEGWLDYIIPQIYWNIGYEVADYEKVLHWWEDVCAGTGVSLYAGHAAYKEADGTAGWTGEIARQLALNAQSSTVQGSVFFRAGSLSGSVGDQIKSFYAAKPPVQAAAPSVATSPAVTSSVAAPSVSASAPIIKIPDPTYKANKLTVAQPDANISVTDGKGYTLMGTGNPDKALFVNGQPVINRTPEGFFSYYAPLVKGENRFTFTQDGQSPITRIITLKDVPITYPTVLSKPALSNVYPDVAELASAGDTVTFKCSAPAGAIVTVKINGTIVTLSQDNPGIKNSSSTIYQAAYSGTYTVPDNIAAGGVTDLGQPVYTLKFNEKSTMTKAKGAVKLVGSSAPIYAETTAESAWIYPKATTNNGSAWQIVKGQKDRITAVTGNGGWVRLACGGWVEAENVKQYSEATFLSDAISGGSYINGINEDIIKWKATDYPALAVDYDGKTMTVRFGLQKNAPTHNISPITTLFESIRANADSGMPSYTLTLRDSVRLDGFYTDYVNGELRLHLKKRKILAPGEKPFAGFTFVVDPGHGQSATGALGPLGKTLAEKDLNLINAQKLAARLTQLGASVIATRSTDVNPSLYERTEVSRIINPDMFISIHCNSMAESTDSTEIRGLSVWHYNPASLSLAKTLITNLYDVNPRTTRRPDVNQSNFYVCRPSWAPSVIIETSFMCNIEDYAWLINETRQNELADRITSAMLAYYQ